jgi:hypothetical protein
VRDSDTYLAILDEGRIEEVKKLIVRLGQKWLVSPAESVTATLGAITDLDRLERLHERLGDVKSWEELLAVP